MTADKILRITETNPTTLVKDFDAFVNYIQENNPSLVRRDHFLTKKTLHQIEQVMSNPDPENTPEISRFFYPYLSLFYYLALKSSLFIKTDKLKLQKTERLTIYEHLTPNEKYFFLLETFWVDTFWGELLRRRSSLSIIPKVQEIIKYLTRIPPGKVFSMKELGRAWRISWDTYCFLQYLESFGLIQITFDRETEEQQPYYEGSVTVTELGKTFFPILYSERNIIRWNIPYIQERTGKFIIFPGLRKKRKRKNAGYEPFFKPFQKFFKGELEKTLPRNREYRKGIFTFKVSLRGGCSRTIAASSEHTLEDLHEAIQEAFDFDRDHLYAFFMDGLPWSQDHIYAPQNTEGPFSDRVCIGNLGVLPGQRFLYLFDFGDEWHFKTEVLEICDKPGPPSPVITERKGKSPEQYPDTDYEDDENYENDADYEEL